MSIKPKDLGKTSIIDLYLVSVYSDLCTRISYAAYDENIIMEKLILKVLIFLVAAFMGITCLSKNNLLTARRLIAFNLGSNRNDLIDGPTKFPDETRTLSLSQYGLLTRLSC